MDDDKLSTILLQVGEAKGKLKSMALDLIHIKNGMVARGECTGKHRIVEENITRTVSRLREELKTGLDEIKQTTENSFAGIPSEKKMKAITWYIGTAATILGMLGALGAGMWKITSEINNMRSGIVVKQLELRDQLDKLKTEIKKINE